MLEIPFGLLNAQILSRRYVNKMTQPVRASGFYIHSRCRCYTSKKKNISNQLDIIIYTQTYASHKCIHTYYIIVQTQMIPSHPPPHTCTTSCGTCAKKERTQFGLMAYTRRVMVRTFIIVYTVYTAAWCRTTTTTLYSVHSARYTITNRLTFLYSSTQRN